jgi:hypothetical protein
MKKTSGLLLVFFALTWGCSEKVGFSPAEPALRLPKNFVPLEYKRAMRTTSSRCYLRSSTRSRASGAIPSW